MRARGAAATLFVTSLALVMGPACSSGQGLGRCEHIEGHLTKIDHTFEGGDRCGPFDGANALYHPMIDGENIVLLTFFTKGVEHPDLIGAEPQIRIDLTDVAEGDEVPIVEGSFCATYDNDLCGDQAPLTDGTIRFLGTGKEDTINDRYYRFEWDLTFGEPDGTGAWQRAWGNDWIGIDREP